MLMQDAETIKKFTLAGNATLTLASKKSGVHLTYKVKKVPDSETKFFVSLLSGPSNESDYSYLGLLDGGQFRLTKKSRATDQAPSVKAIKFFCDKVLGAGRVPEELEVRHDGRCGRCHRKLTTPESVDRGIGPDCWGMM